MTWVGANQRAQAKSGRRRRFWSAEDKRRMVAESFAPGALVSRVRSAMASPAACPASLMARA